MGNMNENAGGGGGGGREKEEEEEERNPWNKQSDTHTNPLQSEQFDYKYSKIKCPYRTEKLKLSAKEERIVRELIVETSSAVGGGVSSVKNTTSPADTSSETTTTPVSASASLDSPRKRKIILDTDIGTDSDDVLALLMALRMSDEIEIMGVTTNYYPTKLRALVARTILEAAGREDVPVIAGCDYVCGTHRPFFHFGNEGCGLRLEKKRREELWKPQETKRLAAANFIYRTLKRVPGEVAIVSIGMATNIALAAKVYGDSFDGLASHITIMQGGSVLTKTSKNAPKATDLPWTGGLPDSFAEAKAWMRWTRDAKTATGASVPCRPVVLYPNHNVSGDTLASCMLYDLVKKTPIYVLPHYVTAQHWLNKESAVEKLYRVGEEAFEIAAPSPTAWDLDTSLVDGTEKDRKFLASVAAKTVRDESSGVVDGGTNTKEKRRTTILVMCGSFNPPHRGHVDMLVHAKRAMGTAFGGAIFSLGSDSYVMRKYSRKNAKHDEIILPFAHREALLRTMAKDAGLDETLFHVSSAEADTRKLFYLEVVQHFKHICDNDSAIDFRFLCGSDHGNYLVRNARQGCIAGITVVKRSKGTEFVRRDKWATWAKASDDAVVLLEPVKGGGDHLSSTELRKVLGASTSDDDDVLVSALSEYFTPSAMTYFVRHLWFRYYFRHPRDDVASRLVENGGTAKEKEGIAEKTAEGIEAVVSKSNGGEGDADELTKVVGVFVWHWLKRRGYVGQCPHDPLTLYEAIYLDSHAPELDDKHDDDDADIFVPKRSCVRYARGTIVCCEWAGYFVFVPDPRHGTHFLAVESVCPRIRGTRESAFSCWLSEVLLKRKSEKRA
eukprot:g81.t1